MEQPIFSGRETAIEIGSVNAIKSKEIKKKITKPPALKDEKPDIMREIKIAITIELKEIIVRLAIRDKQIVEIISVGLKPAADSNLNKPAKIKSVASSRFGNVEIIKDRLNSSDDRREFVPVSKDVFRKIAGIKEKHKSEVEDVLSKIVVKREFVPNEIEEIDKMQIEEIIRDAIIGFMTAATRDVCSKNAGDIIRELITIGTDAMKIGKDNCGIREESAEDNI